MKKFILSFVLFTGAAHQAFAEDIVSGEIIFTTPACPTQYLNEKLAFAQDTDDKEQVEYLISSPGDKRCYLLPKKTFFIVRDRIDTVTSKITFYLGANSHVAYVQNKYIDIPDD